MNFGDNTGTFTGISAAAITAAKIVNFSSDADNTVRTVASATASTSFVAGITETDANAAGQEIRVRHAGITRLMVDGNAGAIVPGDKLVSNSAGLGVKAGAAGATTQHTAAIALQGSTASGDIIDVMLEHSEIVKGTA